ncbi:MAG: response regulator transcription factor [Sporolactobacillus sp.]
MQNMSKILIVDDEAHSRRLMKLYLEREGYQIDELGLGELAVKQAAEHDYVLVILDLMLPDLSGLDICKRLKKLNPIPIMIVTARGEETDRIRGFESGADDYVVKPFVPKELVLRVKALMRRLSKNAYLLSDMKAKSGVILPHFMIDHSAHRVLVDNQPLNLTPKEFDLLYYLAKNSNRVCSREQLLKDVWDYAYFGSDLRTIDTHVKRLRAKLNELSKQAAEMIETVWGIGYRMTFINSTFTV